MECYYFMCGNNQTETREKLKEEIKRWLLAPELVAIVEAFGGKYPDIKNTKQLASWLLKFSEKWDYRQKQKPATDVKTGETFRWIVKNDSITEVQREAVYKGINMLGLRNVLVPYYDSYDYVVTWWGKNGMSVSSEICSAARSRDETSPQSGCYAFGYETCGGYRERSDRYVCACCFNRI